MAEKTDREFFYRRLHSLLGVIPVGLFLVEHLFTNYFAVSGATAYNDAVKFLEELQFRYFLEIFFIFIPLLYHAVYGLYIAFQAKNNVSRYGYFRNWMFMLQRVTGIITLIYITWHVWETRVQAAFGAEVNFNMMVKILDNPFMFAFYIIGILSAVFHFANGLWSFAVTWGITQSPRSQQITTYVTMVIFVLVSYMGIRALFAFIDPTLANM
ncbi:succinate dehydrogenase cytochrome b558 subunit [Bacillus marinisedimentorum]|uniref:succinate dehydrogenase cytochrome b558 subunit n=1 Tax=Bacillus marinisedimentorum TaxID=1821260 RepID=UPI000871D2E7|nr:succinate dehydrogenase cytochrome b558 subunit [Bacillus marinisedimentorum]